MMEFGKTLRLAREAKGMTIDDVAEQTRIMARTIENLEREIFSDIVAPIYGRGFVKLYCEAVGIDARPMIDEFMEIYNGNREAVIVERQVAAAAAPVTEAEVTETTAAASEAAEVTASEPPLRPAVSIPENDLFSPGPSSCSAPAENGPGNAVQQEPQIPDAEPSPRPSVGANFSRYAASIDNYVDRPGFKWPTIPAAVWRVGALAVIALAVLWTLGTGIRALYRCTMPAEDEKPAVPDASAVPPPGKAPVTTAVKPAPRTPVKIPPLYID